MKTIAVDCNYVETEFATSYLMIQNGRGMFVECNTNYAIPYLIEAAKKEGLSAEQIDGLIITHVHLDHAGGAGLFLREFPNARLYAHPRAARHAIDPSKLIAGATQVYGEAFMKKMYGDILPCPAERVTVLEDGAPISWRQSVEGVDLKTKHTRGHANHHLCVIEPVTQTLFSGDSFGVSYPKINQKHPDAEPVIVASTSPTDFDGNAAIETVNWIESQNPAQIGLTHFGFLPRPHIAAAAQSLRDYIRFSIALVAKVKSEDLASEQITEHIKDWVIEYYHHKRIQLDMDSLRLLKVDMQVNAQGLLHAAKIS